jgi:hypothetical protein
MDERQRKKRGKTMPLLKIKLQTQLLQNPPTRDLIKRGNLEL